jgi:hypothetical protein
MNVRMTKTPQQTFMHDDIMMAPGDKLMYFFTYCIQGSDCDTEIYEYEMAAPPQAPIMAPQPRVSCPVFDFHQSVEQIQDNEYKIMFHAMTDRSVEWVVAHYSINVAASDTNWQMNVHMMQNQNTPHMFELENIMLHPGDELMYSFTYCTEGVDCNTQAFTFSVPAPIMQEAPAVCPIFDYTYSVDAAGAATNAGTPYMISFIAHTTRSIEWVDVHISAPQMLNYRMQSAAATATQKTFAFSSINLHPGDTLSFSFTYCSEGVDCNTAMFSFHVPMPQPVMQQKAVMQTPSVCPVIEWSADISAIGSPAADSSTPHKIVFNGMTTRSVEWVNLHISLNSEASGWQLNYAMRPATSTTTMKTFEYSPIILKSGDVLRYAFTYCSQGVDCDTEIKTFAFRPSLMLQLPMPVLTSTAMPAPGKQHEQTLTVTIMPAMSSSAMPSPKTQSSIVQAISTSTAVNLASSMKTCKPVQFTHRALSYIDQVGKPKTRLLFLANAASQIDTVMVKYLICNATLNQCPANAINLPDSAWNDIRAMGPVENLPQGFELMNAPALMPGDRIIYTFTYTSAATNNECSTGPLTRDV